MKRINVTKLKIASLLVIVGCGKGTHNLGSSADESSTEPLNKQQISDDSKTNSQLGLVSSSKLTCGFPGLEVPPTTNFIVNNGHSVHASIGLAEKFGLVGAKFELYHKGSNERLNILDGISAAGAGWQFSALGQTKNLRENKVFVFNQGTGNMDQQWGILNNISFSDVIPFPSDHAHPVDGVIPQFNIRELHSPCTNRSSGVKPAELHFNGNVRLNLSSTEVLGDTKNRNWPKRRISNLEHVTTLTPLRPEIKYRWFKTEHGLYLDKWIAARHNLRIYLLYPSTTEQNQMRVKGPISPHWDKYFMKITDDQEPLLFAQADGAQVDESKSARKLDCGNWLEKERCAVGTDDLAMAILVWQPDQGEQIGLAIHRADFSKFYSFIARTLSHRCVDSSGQPTAMTTLANSAGSIDDIKKYHLCGNLEFHAFMSGPDNLREEEFVLNKKETYRLTYSIGTLRELIQFAEDKLKIRLDVDSEGAMKIQNR